MRLGVFITLIFAFFIQSVAPARADDSYRPPYAPKLLTNDDLIAYLLYLHEVLPEAFVKGGWYVNPLTVVQNEQEFLRWLRQPEIEQMYKDSLPDRQFPKLIEILFEVAVTSQQFAVSKAVLIALDQQLKDLSQQLGSKPAINELIEIYTTLGGRSSQGLLTGMIQSLPPELKAQAFKMEPADKLQFLLNNLTNEMLQKNFRSNTYSDAQKTVEFLVAEYGDVVKIETQLVQLAFLSAQQQGADLATLVSENDSRKSDKWQALIGTRLEEKASRELSGILEKTSKAYLETISSEEAFVEWQFGEKLRIEEVTPNLGVFRGCLNGDCFTTYSYGFTYSPGDRTYLLRDGEGKIIFSIYAMDALVDGKKTLYVHEMGNPNAKPTYADLAMRALDAAAKQLGFEQIYLAQKSMHDSKFKVAIEQRAQDSEYVDIQLVDEALRSQIGLKLVEMTGNTYSKSHDSPEMHKKARPYKPKADSKLRVSVEVSDFTMESFTKRQFSNDEKRDLLMEFLGRKETEMAKIIFEGFSQGAKDFEELTKAIDNTEKLPIDDHFANVQDTFGKFGMGWRDEFIDKYELAFAEGYLRSPDSWQGEGANEVSEKTMRLVIAIAKKEPQAPILNELFKYHPDIVTSAAFEKLFRGYLKDNQASLTKSALLMRYFFNKNISPELIDALYSVYKFENLRLIGTSLPTQILKTVPHTPTEAQFELMAYALENLPSERAYLLPHLWQHREWLGQPIIEALRRILEKEPSNATVKKILDQLMPVVPFNPGALMCQQIFNAA